MQKLAKFHTTALAQASPDTFSLDDTAGQLELRDVTGSVEANLQREWSCQSSGATAAQYCVRMQQAAH